MVKIKYILCATGLLLFFITNTNIYSQFVQTEGPFDSLHIYFVASSDRFIFAGTNAGFFYTDSLPGQWKLLTRAKVSAFASRGDLAFSGGQYTGLIICDLSKPNILIDTVYYGMTINSMHATDSFLYIGEINFNRINLFDYYSFGRYNEGLPSNEFHINSITQIQNKLFCATNKGIYKANDRNLIWSPINNGLPKDNVQMVKAIQDTLFAGINNNLYFSADTGTSWSLFFNAPSYITSIIKNDGVYYISTLGNGIYSTPFDTIHRTTVNSGLTDLKVASLGLNKNTLICGTNTGGLFYKTNSIWVVNNSGTITSSIWSITISNSGIIGSNEYDVYLSVDANTWQKITPKQPNKHYEYYGELCSCGDTIYLSAGREYTEERYIYYTINNGQNWTQINSVPFERDDAYTLRCKNGRLYISEDDLIYYTDNMGVTWTRASSTNILNECSFSPSDPFCDKSIQQLILSTDQSWIDYVNEFTEIPYTYYLNYIANTDDALFANFYLYVYVKSDTCPYWTQVANTPSGNQGIRSYAYTGKNLFITTLRWGVYSTDDYGISWKRLNTSSIDTNILGPLAIKDSILYIGTYGSGVWKYDLNTLDFSINAKCPCNNNSNISEKLLLYPNPASDYLYIQSDDSGIKETSIYDITGSLVLYQKVNLDEPIDLRGFIEGIYFIKIRTENEFLCGKFCVSY